MGAPTGEKRLGRPPAADSAHTRDTLLRVARAKFAELGYQSATNKDIAEAAGITTGAIYHYFGSKRDLYGAVFEQVEATVYERYESVLEDGATFADNFVRLLGEAVRIHADDATIAQFFIEVQTEAMRNPELSALATEQARNTVRLLAPIVESGHAAGEFVDEVNPRAVTYAMMSVMTGVARFSETLEQPEILADATGVLARLITGDLYR